MKKLILMLGVISLIHVEPKAQEPLQFIAANNFPSDKTASFSTPYNNPEEDYNYYMHKSKRSRNTGLILLGSGVLISGIGAILSFGNGQGYAYDESKGDAGAVMLLTGAAAGIASIPFMAVALGRSNKAKAMLGTQKTGFGVPANVSKDIAGITLQIPLGK